MNSAGVRPGSLEQAEDLQGPGKLQGARTLGKLYLKRQGDDASQTLASLAIPPRCPYGPNARRY